jgi:tRNA(Ile)-lysidine synthase
MVAKPYLIRPILECTRKMIEGYAFVHKVPYRTDSTNASSDYKRNRIRNDIFPIFEKINPSFVRTLNREMGYFEEALEIVEDYCAQQSSGMAGLGRPAAECLISVPELLSHKHWRYLLYYMLEPYGFNAASLASVENLLESDRTISGKRFESPTHELVVERSNLCVRPISEEISSVLEQRNDEISGDAIMEVRCPGIYNFNSSRWQVEVMDRDQDMPLKQPQGVLIADADKLAFPFVCRRWRHGDWMIPFGMKGRKKVSDIFADLKFTSHEKDQAAMIVDCRGNLADQQHIAGILGIRMDDRYKVTAATKKIIRITLL